MIEGGVWPLVGADEMRVLDRYTIDTLGVPGEVLMESAGRAVTEEVLRALPDAETTVTVLCGPGNNGGDGLVVARLLLHAGIPVRARLLGDPARLTGDAALNRDRAQRAGVTFEDAAGPFEPGLVVDALFGTGMTRALEGTAAEVVASLEEARSRGVVSTVVAVDVPSGLDSETGQVLGACVRADTTVTIGLPKLGLALEPGRSLAGRVVVARIGIADQAPDLRPRAALWTPLAAGRHLPERPRDGHKGTFGHVLVVAGSEGKTGAAALAASGAARMGAGLVTIACPASLNDILEVKCTEAMTAPVPETADRAFAAAAEAVVLELAAERDVVAAGPGVGRSEETGALMRALAARVDKPLVLDADGLYALRDEPKLLAEREAPTVLTPHPGEAATLLGRSPADINRDRLGAARELAERTGSVVLLKGAATVVATPEGAAAVNPTGGPALAAGGSGDVLLGVVAACLSQGVAPFEAAVLAAWVHGRAADALEQASGPAGQRASEIADSLPAAADALRRVARATPEGAVPETGRGLAVPLLES